MMATKSLTKPRVPSIPKALKALAVMERELDSAKTYESIRKILRAAEAMKVLLADVAEVKQQAEWVVLVANTRIGEEIEKVPKATAPHRHPSQKLPGGVNSKSGRGALGVPGTSRGRLVKLAAIGKNKLKVMATELWDSGKDATVKAILGENKEKEIIRKRADFEARRDRGANAGDLVAMAEAGLRFPVIYADPPWEFKVYSGKRKQRSAERHYDTSSLDAIKALPVAPLAAENCTLFLWAVWPELRGALEVIEAWGFTYKTAGFVWIKEVSETNDNVATGMGYWTRANSELCILATRGSPERIAKDVSQVIMAPAGEHSVKPEETRRRIERLVLGPYLEIFARHAVAGWTVWGNEIERAIEEAAE